MKQIGLIPALFLFVAGGIRLFTGAGPWEVIVCFGAGIAGILAVFILALIFDQGKKKNEGGSNER